MFNKIKINRGFWINFAFFAAGGILLIYFYQKYRVAPKLDFSEMQLRTPEGQPVDLSRYKGKVLFLNFWETWCGPCVQEMPTIENAKQQLDTSRFVFIAVGEEDPAKIAAFRDKYGYSFLFLVSPKKFQEMGINAYPTTYIYNSEGKLELTRIGGVDWSSPEMVERIRGMAR